jgi:hypothetical protein
MISSLLSAVATFIFILYGWFKKRIRGFPEHQADIHIRSVFRCYKNSSASEKSLKDFETIILAFSDQQLITGLALLLSIYIKGDITVYTFEVATALAWFSSTIHLATLVVLKE